jgi:hypothetical protein
VLRSNISNYVQDRTPRTDGTENPWRGNVEHFPLQLPRFIFTGYSGSLRQSHYDYAKEQFFAGLEHLELPREITETALANASAIRPKTHPGGVTRWRSDAS